MTTRQVDGQCTETDVHAGQLSSRVAAAPPARPLSWQSAASTSCQLTGLVQLHGQPALDAIARLPGASDGGNSRDSWSSTSSNVVARQQVAADQQRPAYHEPAPYSRQVHGQQYHLYDWARRHTWAQVQTDQSTCLYPQHVRPPRSETFHYANRRPQNNQHQYLRPTSTSHPYLHQAAIHQPSACSATHQVAGIQQVHTTQFNAPAQLIARHPGVELSNSGSRWIGTEQQRAATTHDGPPPSTPLQLNTASQTLTPCRQWSDSARTAMSETWHQSQDAGLLINGATSILPGDVSGRWFAQPSYDNVVNDAGLYRVNDPHQL